ncbi:MAG: NAD(P)/FAD-dependent oxidoreductase [Pseudomonadales bacterium]
MPKESHDVVIIGAGPVGSIAAAMLKRAGVAALVLEGQQFPRFSIGESLLPYCMTYIEQAGMLDLVNRAGFQLKDGAVFWRDGKQATFDFTKKYGAGPGTTFQVQRADFDKLLADEAAGMGVEIRYGHKVGAVSLDPSPSLDITTDQGDGYQLDCRFVLDASGFGRVLPRLLDMEQPSEFPVRSSVFTHISDGIGASGHAGYDRNKILIIVHPEHSDVWYWLIPFSNGRSSLGVVGEPQLLQSLGDDPLSALKLLVSQDRGLADLLKNADYDTEARQMTGYAANVTSLWGKGFALLGNAGEFLDPIFSSGVTIAMKSAGLAAPLVAKQLGGEPVDWEADYAQPLKLGVDTFKEFVTSWYDGKFQDVVFAPPSRDDNVRSMICAILAGYAWNQDNPYVAQTRRRLEALVEVCRGQ